MGNTPRIGVDNHAAWGRLVKSWATGRDYVTFVPTATKFVPDEPAAGAPVPFPKPTSFKDMVTRCLAHNVGIHFVATATTQKVFCTGNESIGFVLLQGSPEISILRLPPKEKLHESEASLLGGGGVAGMNYTLPHFYEEAFGDGTATGQMHSMTERQKMEFHAQRIGEYTLNVCI
jgi:hypothetical protein